MRDLGTLGGAHCWALDINASGQVIGYSTTSENPLASRRAFLYSDRMIDLNTLLPPGSGWLLREAYAMNDRGQIVGRGLLNGRARAFLMSPPGVLPATPPQAPTGLTAQVMSLQQIDLQWTDRSNDEHGFEVERSNGETWVKIATVLVNTSSFSDTTVNGYGRFRYRVRALNGSGGSDWSAEASAAIGPTVVLNPERLSYSERRVGTISEELTLTVTNAGNAPLSIRSISLEGANPEEFTAAGFGGFVLAPNQSGNVKVRFAPRAAGTRTAVLTLVTDAEGSPHTLPVTGTAVAPVLSVGISGLGTPGTINFGAQTLSGMGSTKTVTLTNTGNAPLTVTGVSLGGAQAGDFALAAPAGSGTLAPGATRTVSLRFTPLSAGSRTAQLKINSDAPGSPHSVALTGTGFVPLGGRNEGSPSGMAVRELIPTGSELRITAIDSTTVNSRQVTIDVGQSATLSLLARFKNGATADVATDRNTRFFARPVRGQFTGRNVWTARAEDAGKTVVLYGRYYSPYSRRPIVDQVTVMVRSARTASRR